MTIHCIHACTWLVISATPITTRNRSSETTRSVKPRLKDTDTNSQDFNTTIVSSDPVSDMGLLEISHEEFVWRNMAICLDIEQGEQQRIDSNQPDLQQKKLQMLLKWKKMNGEVATYRRLAEAAMKEKNRVLAEKIRAIADS